MYQYNFKGVVTLNEKEKLELFKNEFLFCKEEVVDSFNAFVDHHKQTDNEEEYSESKRRTLLALCDKFKEALLNCKLPDLTNSWWFYEYDVTNDSIDLSLWHCDSINFNEDGTPDEMTSSNQFTLLNIICDYLTVEDYAALYGVTTTTVRQWIRRGKLRTAKKMGRDWLIPAIADKPKRGFLDATYTWENIPQNTLNEFPFLRGYNYIYLYQDDANKTQFYCVLGRPGDKNRHRIPMNTTDREKLEIALIAIPNVTAEESCIKFVAGKTS